MRNLFFLLFFAGFTASLNAQTSATAERVAPVQSPKEVEIHQFDYYFSGLQTALKTGDATSVNYHYGELMMMMRMAIQRAEDAHKQEDALLTRQKAILAAFEGFEFRNATPADAAPKLELLQAYQAMLKTK
jgi:hypothetical protein